MQAFDQIGFQYTVVQSADLVHMLVVPSVRQSMRRIQVHVVCLLAWRYCLDLPTGACVALTLLRVIEMLDQLLCHLYMLEFDQL